MIKRETPPADRRRRRRLFGLCAAVSAAAWIIPVRPGIVWGGSMEPTLHTGDPFLFKRASESQRLRRYDLVLVKLLGRTCIKRVVGLEGDRFYRIHVKGQPDDPLNSLILALQLRAFRARYHRVLGFTLVAIPRGCIYVMGDSNTSLDSRQLGPVPRSAVLGRVVAIHQRGQYDGPGIALPPAAPVYVAHQRSSASIRRLPTSS